MNSACIARAGELTFIASDSPTSEFSVLFEDDGESGYFYALDSANENRIVDAMLIYNVDAVVDRDQENELRIEWSMDGMRSVLRVNGIPHAVFDFAAKRGYCRSNYPNFDNPVDGWRSHSHAWDEAPEME